MEIKERINCLQKLMKENDIQAYIIPTDDFHSSEYVGDYFKCREYMSGFTGSAGTLVVLEESAYLWKQGMLGNCSFSNRCRTFGTSFGRRL